MSDNNHQHTVSPLYREKVSSKDVSKIYQSEYTASELNESLRGLSEIIDNIKSTTTSDRINAIGETVEETREQIAILQLKLDDLKWELL